MRTQRFLLALLVSWIAVCASARAADNFSKLKLPDSPGEREASAVLDLKGLKIGDVTVSVVYSDKEAAVRDSFDVKKRKPSSYSSINAKLKDLGDGTALCTVIFPHRDLPDAKGAIYNHPTTVYYAWAEEFKPKGATETLTLNSPVGSFEMPRFLIIAYVGDSYASGEGAPNVNSSFGKAAEWDDKNCHRSQRSGGALAIQKLIDKHPEWAIRTVNTTCSGAILADFYSHRARKDENFTQDAQFKQIADWLKRYDRKVVDILLADGGGNDAGMVEVGVAAFCPGDFEKEKEHALLAIADLPARYDAMSSFIEGEEFGFEVGKVVWMNYPNPFNDANGKLCTPESKGDCWAIVEEQATKHDMTFLRDKMFIPLNKAVKAAAEKYGWDLVDVFDTSKNNGLCNCADAWFNTLGRSVWDVQGDERGTMHPNAKGYRLIYQDKVYNQLVASIRDWHSELKHDAMERAKAKAIAKIKAKARAAAARDEAAKSPAAVLKMPTIPHAAAPSKHGLDESSLAQEPAAKPARDGSD